MNDETQETQDWEWQLLEGRLGWLDPEQTGKQAEKLKARLAESPELAARDRALGELLGILDHCRVPAPSPDLAGRVLDGISAPVDMLRFASEQADPHAHPLPHGQNVAGPQGRWGLRDAAAVAACLILLFAVGVPGYSKARQTSLRSQCLNNLRQIGQELSRYCAVHGGYLPYADHIPGGSWLPTDEPGVPYASNTRHLAVLVRSGQVGNIRIFFCPASRERHPQPAGDPRDWTDLPPQARQSYSFIYMNWPQGRRLEDLRHPNGFRMVLMADRNPHFARAGCVRPGQAAEAPAECNSPLHENGAGQNVIYTDGAGQWLKRPVIGGDDDIYRVGRLTRYRGTEAPLYETDTFLP